MENYNLMSNKELMDKYNEFIKQFENAQNELKENYTLMVHCSSEVNKIKEILNKRGTNI